MGQVFAWSEGAVEVLLLASRFSFRPIDGRAKFLVQALSLLPFERVDIANDPSGSHLSDRLFESLVGRSLALLSGLLVDIFKDLLLLEGVLGDLERFVLCVPFHLDLFSVKVRVDTLFENLSKASCTLHHLEQVDNTEQSHWHDDALGFGPPEDVQVLCADLRVELVLGFEVGLVDVDFAGGVHYNKYYYV